MSCRKIKSEIKELSSNLLKLKDKRNKLIRRIDLEDKKLIKKLNTKLLDEIGYEKDTLYYNLSKLEIKIKNLESKMNTDDFLIKRDYDSNYYDLKYNQEYKKMEEDILNSTKQEKENLQYIISIYEKNINIIDLEKDKLKILENGKKELNLLYKKKTNELTQVRALYNNLVNLCKGKCDLKNEEYVKNLAKILGNKHLEMKDYNIDLLIKMIENNKCCKKMQINTDNIFENKCKLIGGEKTCSLEKMSLGDLKNEKQKDLRLIKLYNNEIKKYKIPKIILDNDNKYIKDKIKILEKQYDNKLNEYNKYKDVIVPEISVSLNCFNEDATSDEKKLCKLVEDEKNIVNELKTKYKQYYKEYGCLDIENDIISEDNLYIKDMKSCKKYLKKNIDNQLSDINKIIEELNKKHLKSEKIVNQIENEIMMYKNKKENFNCSKNLAKFSKQVLKRLEDVYKKCICSVN